MSLTSTHPEYDEMLDDWRQMRDTYRGQREVKRAGSLYLPPTRSMIIDGALRAQEPGLSVYTSYIQRAVFPDLVR